MNGKGSKRRPQFVTNKEYARNFERIFGKNKHITIIQHQMIGAPHWYVISSDSEILEKFIHLDDAKEFALFHAKPENIEISD